MIHVSLKRNSIILFSFDSVGERVFNVMEALDRLRNMGYELHLCDFGHKFFIREDDE